MNNTINIYSNTVKSIAKGNPLIAFDNRQVKKKNYYELNNNLIIKKYQISYIILNK